MLHRRRGRAREPASPQHRPHHLGVRLPALGLDVATLARAARTRAGGHPDDEIDKITHENAMRIFQFDPFSARAKKKCTVGALRAEAADVDVSERAVTGAAPRDPSRAADHDHDDRGRPSRDPEAGPRTTISSGARRRSPRHLARCPGGRDGPAEPRSRSGRARPRCREDSRRRRRRAPCPWSTRCHRSTR